MAWGWNNVKPDPSLKPCPWCGKPAGLRRDEHVRDWDGMPYRICDQWQVRCTGDRCISTCLIDEEHLDYGQTVGYANAPGEAKRRWQAREVTIPFWIDLPNNHLVLERVPQKTTWSHERKSILKIKVARERGIAAHFMRKLNFLIEDGEPQPCRFTISAPMETLTASLLKVESDEQWRPDQPNLFTFFVHGTMERLANNRQDEAWLKRPGARPPIYENMMKKMHEGYEGEPEDEP